MDGASRSSAVERAPATQHYTLSRKWKTSRRRFIIHESSSCVFVSVVAQLQPTCQSQEVLAPDYTGPPKKPPRVIS